MQSHAAPWIEVARDFLERAGHPTLPRGAEGIRILSELIDRQAWADAEQDDDAERMFVDGAGATLGLLLIEHLGRGRCLGDEQPGWMALGERGAFQPFAAVEAAIDSDTPRRVLRDRVVEAENEAAGTGRGARTVGIFEQLLSLRRPELILIERRGLRMVLGDGIEVDLANAASVGGDEDEDAREGAVSRLVREIPGGDDRHGATGWDEASRRLLPRLVSRRFVDEIAAYNGAGALYAAPFSGDVRLALILSYPGRSRFVRAVEVDGWGRDEEELREAILTRLAARSQQTSLAAVDTDAGTMVVARTGDGHDAARLLLPGLFGVLSRELEPPIVAAIPHRDALLAVSGRSPRMVDALSLRAKEDASAARHAITSELFEVRRRGVRAYRR